MENRETLEETSQTGKQTLAGGQGRNNYFICIYIEITYQWICKSDEDAFFTIV